MSVGLYGQYGGRYVPETLIPALDELEAGWRVAQADGPERLHGEWWREAGYEADQPFHVRDYYQVETTTGGRYWLFRQGDGENPATGPMRWFLHGAFA